MRKASAGLLALVVGFGPAVQAKDVELVSKGAAKAEIVVSRTPVSVVRFAALELQAHVRAITGVELPIVADGARTGAYPIFIGGCTSATRDFDFGKLPEQGFIVDIGETRTVLLGRDSERSDAVSVVYGENPGVIVSAKGLPHVLDSVFEARGSLDAVYGFLHANCGVDWLDCTEAGVSCPARETLAVGSGRTVDSPFVRCRDVAIDPEEWNGARDAAGLLRYRKTAWPRAFAEAKDERAAQARVKLAKDVFALRLRVGGERIHANHSFYWCYDRFWDRKNARFIAYRPEWFSKHLKKAKKGMAADGEIFSAFDTSVKPAQMCYSNEGFIHQTVVDVRAYFDAGGYTNTYTNQGRPCDARRPIASWGKDVYCLEPMDNNGFCECPDCRGQYRPERKDDRAECSDYWFGFVNKVAREIKKSHPDKRISTLAYGPRREGLPSFPLEDNVVVHFCWDSNRGPNREPLMTKQTDLMRKWRAAYPNRPLGLWLYGGFPHESGTWAKYNPPPGFFGALFDREMKFIRDLNIRECIFNCGLKDDFELFLGGRLMWNPSEDYETLKTEYFRGFGPAERAMRRFYEIIEERICTRDYYEGYAAHMNRDVAYGKLLTDEVFDRLAQAMAEAEAAVGTGGTSWQKARVRNWRVGYWDYLLGARYMRFEQPDPAPGVHLTCTECYSAKPRPLGGPDALAGLPFAAKGSGGGFLWGLDPKTGDRPESYRAMTTEAGFNGFWNGPNPTQLVYRCDVRIGRLTRLRIVTSDFARSRMFFNLVGWRKGRKVMLLEGVDFPRALFAKGSAVWDLDFEDAVAPRDLDALGIEERFWEKKYTAAPRYMRIQAVDGEDETERIQKSIDDAWRKGGGEVRLGAGVHRVASLRLRSRVTLHLGRDCILRGTFDPRAYDDLLRRDRVEPVPAAELGLDTTSTPEYLANNPPVRGYLYGGRWNNAIVRLYHAHDCGIVGEPGSAIEGQNCADPLGEERYRGPHAINAVLSTNLVFRGYAVRDAGNYAHRIMACANVRIDGVSVRGGHDGVNLRDVDHVRVTNCDIAAGDDALAGRANTDVVVSRCVLNSACSPVRFGGSDVLIADCRATGPNAYPHRYMMPYARRLAGAAAAADEGRRNMGCFFQYFTGEDLKLRKRPGKIVFRNFKVENPGRFMVMLTGLGALWQSGPAIDRIRFENLEVTGIERPSAIWAPAAQPLTLEFVNCRFAFKTPQPYAFTGANLTVKVKNTQFEGAEKTYMAWTGPADDFIKQAVPEFPSWSFERPEADLR